MSNKNNVIQIPQHEIESLARCLLPDLIEYYKSKDGQREFEQWKNDIKKNKHK